jgi:hypothetical protein
LRLARRLTVVINNKISETAYGAEPGAGTSGHFGFPPSVEPTCPSLSAERYADKKLGKCWGWFLPSSINRACANT